MVVFNYRVMSFYQRIWKLLKISALFSVLMAPSLSYSFNLKNVSDIPPFDTKKNDVSVEQTLNVDDIPVVALFGTGAYDEHTFDDFKEYVEGRSNRLKIVPVKLGTGSQDEELDNLHHLIDKLKKSILHNKILSNKFELHKKTDQKKPKIALVTASLSGLYARGLLQKEADTLPFDVEKFVSICAPQAGLFNLPLVKTYENPVEKKCAEIQKLMTNKFLSLNINSSTSNTQTTNTSSSSSNSTSSYLTSTFFSFLLPVASYLGLDKSMAYRTLYTKTSQEKYSAANTWYDPYHHDTYLEINNYLPVYNMEIKSKTNKNFIDNLNRTSYFHFIASSDDPFIPKETATLCEHITGYDNLYTPAFTSKNAKIVGLGNRLGLKKAYKEKRVTFDVVKNAGHRGPTDPGIIEKAGNYVLALDPMAVIPKKEIKK